MGLAKDSARLFRFYIEANALMSLQPLGMVHPLDIVPFMLRTDLKITLRVHASVEHSVTFMLLSRQSSLVDQISEYSSSQSKLPASFTLTIFDLLLKAYMFDRGSGYMCRFLVCNLLTKYKNTFDLAPPQHTKLNAMQLKNIKLLFGSMLLLFKQAYHQMHFSSDRRHCLHMYVLIPIL